MSTANLWSQYKFLKSTGLTTLTSAVAHIDAGNADTDFKTYDWVTSHYADTDASTFQKPNAPRPLMSFQPPRTHDETPVMKKWANYKSVKKQQEQQQLQQDKPQPVFQAFVPASDHGVPVSTSAIDLTGIETLANNGDKATSPDAVLLFRLHKMCETMDWAAPVLTEFKTGEFPKLLYRYEVTVNGVNYRDCKWHTLRYAAQMEALATTIDALGGDTSLPGYGFSPLPDPQPAKKARAMSPIKGISSNPGMKMMMQMGYKPGGGLGVHEQGISEPISVKHRQPNNKRSVGLETKKKKKKKKKQKMPMPEEIEEEIEEPTVLEPEDSPINADSDIQYAYNYYEAETEIDPELQWNYDEDGEPELGYNDWNPGPQIPLQEDIGFGEPFADSPLRQDLNEFIDGSLTEEMNPEMGRDQSFADCPIESIHEYPIHPEMHQQQCPDADSPFTTEFNQPAFTEEVPPYEEEYPQNALIRSSHPGMGQKQRSLKSNVRRRFEGTTFTPGQPFADSPLNPEDSRVRGSSTSTEGLFPVQHRVKERPCAVVLPRLVSPDGKPQPLFPTPRHHTSATEEPGARGASLLSKVSFGAPVGTARPPSPAVRRGFLSAPTFEETQKTEEEPVAPEPAPVLVKPSVSVVRRFDAPPTSSTSTGDDGSSATKPTPNPVAVDGALDALQQFCRKRNLGSVTQTVETIFADGKAQLKTITTVDGNRYERFSTLMSKQMAKDLAAAEVQQFIMP